MQRGIRIAQMFVRLAGLVLLVLGIVIWTGHGDTLVRTHAALGVFFVLSLWAVAVFGLVSRIGYVLPARLIIWGIVIGWFGISQQHCSRAPTTGSCECCTSPSASSRSGWPR